MGAGTAAKYSNGDRARCRTRVRTGPLPRRQGLQIPGSERSFGAAEQEEIFPFSLVPLVPAAGVRRAGSAVSRLTLAADAGGQPRAGRVHRRRIAPALMDQMGCRRLSRPARRRPELTARGTAPVRRSQFIIRAGPVVRRGARRRSAGAAPGAPIGAWSARWLARGRPCVLPGRRYRTRNLADYLK